MLPRTPQPFVASALCLAALALCNAPALADAGKLSKEAQAKLDERIMKFPKQLQARAFGPDHIASKRDEYEKAYDLFIRYTEGSIYNPTTQQYDKVNLRAYQQTTDRSWDPRVDGAAKFQAPATVVEPGQTVRYRLFNQLPIQLAPGEAMPANQPAQMPSIVCPPTEPNKPLSFGCFNVTNLHSHGLWVSPSGNSDNVLLAINPSVNFEYEYNIPLDHPAGTFWYHPHVHGTTAMQVASGMTGTLVVYGERAPTMTANGDIDTLLKYISPKENTVNELLMFQQIPYACDVSATTATPVVLTAPANPPVATWSCQYATNKTGIVENFNETNGWGNSGRYTSINGQIQPEIKLSSGEVHRFRMVDAGFQATIFLKIAKVSDTAALEKYLTQKGGTLNVAQVCGGFPVVQFEVASDGLTHGQAIPSGAKDVPVAGQPPTYYNYLQPGYRSDILFSLPEDGYYCVYDGNTVAKQTSLLAIIKADPKLPAKALPTPGKTSQADQTAFLTTALVNAAKTVYPAGPVQDKVVADLNNNLTLSKFVPHKTITQAEIDESTKTLGTKPIPIDFDFGANNDKFQINGQEYRSDVVNQNLVLGGVQTWNLSSSSGNHPYHIHVNPFQIASITAKPGKTIDAQYKDMVGTWRDTLIVTPNVNITINTRYQRYIGEYVLHCHILAHEDQGMMQNVKVSLPDGKGGISGGAHEGHSMGK